MILDGEELKRRLIQETTPASLFKPDALKAGPKQCQTPFGQRNVSETIGALLYESMHCFGTKTI